MFNLGRSGSNTIGEYKRLVDFPYRPDVVILQYFGNDVQDREPLFDPNAGSPDWPQIEKTLSASSSQSAAARLAGDTITRIAGSPFIIWCARALFTCDYLLYSSPPPGASPYLVRLMKEYASPAVWAAHEKDLRQFATYSRERGIPLVVLVFPFLQQLEVSRYYTQKVSAVFRGQGIAVVDMTDLVSDLSLSDRIVNNTDPHASPLVHRIAAEHLLPLVAGGH